jgi:hypothetical protein
VNLLGHPETTLPVGVVVHSDFRAGRDLCASIDDRPIDCTTLANLHVWQNNGIGYRAVRVHITIREKQRAMNG